MYLGMPVEYCDGHGAVLSAAPPAVLSFASAVVLADALAAPHGEPLT